MISGIDEKDMNQRFANLLSSLDSDPAKKAAFQANPLPLLASAGIHLLPVFPTATGTGAAPTPAVHVAPKIHLHGGAGGGPGVAQAAVAAGPAKKIDATTNWWGFDIILDEAFTQDIVNGIADSGGIATTLSPVIVPLAGVSAAAAPVICMTLGLCFVAKVAEIHLLDLNHNGVHWPITWIQLGVLTLSCGLGPAGLAAGAAVWLHPLPN